MKEALYGLAPDPDESVALQPDVVLVKGGASSIRDVSGDGLVWTVDADADGMEDLAVGSIMFLTGRAVGRVVELAPRVDDEEVAVTLAPVDITDIIRDGTFAVDIPFDPSQLITVTTPGLSAPTEPDLGADEEPPQGIRSTPRADETTTTTIDCTTTTATTTVTTTTADLRCTAGTPAPPEEPRPPVLPDGVERSGDVDAPGGEVDEVGPVDLPPGEFSNDASRDRSDPGGNGDTGVDEQPATANLSDTEEGTTQTGGSPASGGCGPGFSAAIPNTLDPIFKPKGLNPGTSATVSGPSAGGQSIALGFGVFAAELTRAASSLTLAVTASASGSATVEGGSGGSSGLELGVEFCFGLKAPTVRTSMSIVDGSVHEATVEVHGIDSVTISLAAGSKNGLSDNRKVRAEIPIELRLQIPPAATGGIPMALTLKYKFLVATAFSAKNSVMTGRGVYGLDGPFGFRFVNGTATALAPRVTVDDKMMDSLRAISVGANGLVVGASLRVQFGLGIPLASAGPFGSLAFVMGTTVGSDLGIVKCRGATLDVTAKAGLGPSVATELKQLGPIFDKVKFETDLTLVESNVFHREGILPQVPICLG